MTSLMLLNLSLPPHYDALHVDRRAKARVLVVDQSGELRHALAVALQSEGFDVLEASTDEAALALSRQKELDVVVVDVRAPDMDGFDLCRRLKAASSVFLPVLHLTDAHSSDEVRARSLDAGADGLLTRPFDPNALRAMVGTLVRLKRAESERAAHSTATSLLEEALDALTAHVALLSSTGEVIAVNRTWTEFAASNGYRDGGTGFGENYLAICDGAVGAGSDKAHAAAAGVRRVIAGEIDQFALDYPCHSPMVKRWFHMTATRTAGSGDVAAIVTHRDDSAEHARVESDSRFRQFVETTHEGVVAMDTAGTITYANPRLATLLGIANDALIGRSFFEFLPSDEAVAAQARYARRDGESRTIEVRAQRSDGALVDLLATESAILDQEGTVVGVLAMLADVTERKSSERAVANALREADLDRRRLHAMMDAIPVGVGLCDLDGHVTHSNAAVARIWGADLPSVPRVEAFGLFRAWWPHNGELLSARDWALARTLATGQTITGQIVEVERFDGTRGYVLNSSAPFFGAEGALLGALFVVVDITELQSAARERERLMASLETERAQLAAVFEQAPAFMAVLRGPDYVFERVNPAYQQLIGHRDVVGRPLLDALPEVAGQGFTQLLDRVRETGEAYIGRRVPMQIARTPGAALETRYLDFVYQPLNDLTDTPGIVAHGVDVTEQVVSTQELQRHKELLQQRFAKLPVPTFLWEARGDDFALIDFNDAARNVIPAFTADAIGRLRSEIFHESVAEGEHLRRALRDDVVVQKKMEIDVGPPSGRRLFDLTIGPQQPNRLLVHAVDTTELAELETQLRHAQKLDSLGSLAGGIAHDFNNLLGVMLSYTGILLEELAPDDPIAADIGEVQNAIHRAASLTAQLLAFGRQQPLRAERVDIRQVLDSSEKLLRRLITEDIAVTIDLDGPEPLFVMVDVSQLEQVIVNLAVNARDAMPNGGTLSISVQEVTVGTNESSRGVMPGPYVRLTVRDTGVGIAEGTIDRIFDPFFTTKEVGKGTGLGLATVYGIVRQSSGFVTVDSVVGHGATFHVFLPVAEAESPSPPPAHASESVAHVDRRTVVLLVEDEERLRHVTERVLRKHGYDVIAAALPLEALALVEDDRVRFDCLVTDVVMPGMSGQDLAARVRELRGPVPVLLLSGYARDTVERRGIIGTDTPLLHKPVKPVDLLRAIAQLLGVREHQRA
ncbi:MAG: response regulator [bacterium]